MLNKNFKDMLCALNGASVEYLLVGAYAMAAHGCPRATGDIDVWVRPTPENAENVWEALTSFGAPMSQIAVQDFCTPDIVYQIGLPPQRIDLLTSISGVEFESAWESRHAVDLDGIPVPVIGLKDLYANKIASGREKDAADIALLRPLLE